MVDDVVIAKVETIENCLRRINEEYADDPVNLFENWTKQDSIILNLERACQASIDLGMRLIRMHGLGIPKESRETFETLHEKAGLPLELTKRMQAMVGFRNVAVHTYQKLDLKIVENIVTERLDDFRQFAQWSLQKGGAVKPRTEPS